jgi:hypothetical protein
LQVVGGRLTRWQSFGEGLKYLGCDRDLDSELFILLFTIVDNSPLLESRERQTLERSASEVPARQKSQTLIEGRGFRPKFPIEAQEHQKAFGQHTCQHNRELKE